MMSPFEPIGDRARWRILYDMLQLVPTNGILTYDRMAEALDLHPESDRHIIQMAMRRAAREHEVVDKRAVDVVPNKGYRVVTAPEHMGLARRQQRRSSRALKAGHSKVVNVDLSNLDPEARKAFEVVARAFAAQMDFNRRIDIRQRRLEEALSTIDERHVRSEEEIAELRRRLEQLEQRNQD
jgi:hypothetical protein